MLKAFERYLHRTRCSERLEIFELTDFVCKVEGIDDRVLAGSAGGGGEVEVIIVWLCVVVEVAAGCPGMNGAEFFFSKAHAVCNLCERTLNGVCLEISGTLIAGERDFGDARAYTGLGIGLEVVDGEEGDEMGEEGMLRDAAALRHRRRSGWGRVDGCSRGRR